MNISNPAQQPAAVSHGDTYRWVAIVAISLLLLFSLFPHLQTKFTTNDDTEFGLQAQIHRGQWIAVARNAAVLQGRFYGVFSTLVAYLPHYFDAPAWYHALALGSILLNFAAFYFLIRELRGSKLEAFFATALAVTFLQNHWHHGLVTAYPVIFHLGLTSLFCAGIAFLRWKRQRRLLSAVVAGVAYFISLMTYESFAPYVFAFLLVSGATFVRERGRGIKKAAFVASGDFLPIASALFLYLAFYVSFRAYHPSQYEGSQLAPHNSLQALLVIWQYTSSTFPGYFFFHDHRSIGATFDGFGPYTPGIRPLLERLRTDWIAKAIVAAAFCGYILVRVRKFSAERTFLPTLVVTVCCMVAPVLLLGLTAKYQEWVAHHGSLAHSPSYFAHFAMAFFITCVVLFINQAVSPLRLWSRVYIGLIGCLIAAGSLLTDYYNHYITLDQQLSQLKWEVVNKLAGTPQFAALPDNAVIYAPSLWTYRGIVASNEQYWSSYLSLKLGRRILVVDRPELLEATRSSPQSDDIYFLQFRQEPKTANHFAVFSRLSDGLTTAGGAVYSDEFTLFTYSKNKEFLLIGVGLPSDQPMEVMVDGLPADQIHGSVFFAKVDHRSATGDLPAITVRSSTPVDVAHLALSYFVSAPAPGPVAIAYGEGFHGLERDVTNQLTWNWSLAESELIITNSAGRPVERSLHFNLISITPRTVRLVGNGIDREIILNEPWGAEPVSLLDVVLQPGINRIRLTSDEAAKLVGGDPRPIAFGVQNLLMKP